MKLNYNVKPMYLDLLCLGISFFLNPVIHFITLTPNVFTPDTIAYMAMAKDIISKGTLYVSSWGHIDEGLILPPLYPFLVALGNLISLETVNVAEYVNSICIVIFSSIAFYYLKYMTTRIVSIITIILIQINYYYFLVGMRPLTEATFLMTLILTLCVLLFITNDNYQKDKKIASLIAGMFCSLVFLSRQIGIILIIFSIIIFIMQWCSLVGMKRKMIIKNMIVMLLGWFIVFAPYAIMLYVQTGQYPFTQSFRENNYMITVEDPEVIKKAKENSILPAELVKEIEGNPDSDYGLMYAQRRRMRKLLPDASEMYSHIEIEDRNQQGAGSLTKAISSIWKPKEYILKLYHNIGYLETSLGRVPTILFCLACISSLLIKYNKVRFTARMLIPLFCIFYIVIVSMFTDKIARYIYIIFPLCLMHISIELYILLNVMNQKIKTKKMSKTIPLVCYICLILIVTPRFFTELTISAKPLRMESGLRKFQEYISGDPVFALQPYYSYVSGGTFRILPDDSLANIAKYGKKTGVRWLLVVRNQNIKQTLRLYKNLQWYIRPLLEEKKSDLIKYRCGMADGMMMLYEIL